MTQTEYEWLRDYCDMMHNDAIITKDKNVARVLTNLEHDLSEFLNEVQDYSDVVDFSNYDN